MQNKINHLIDKFGDPIAIIDHWTNNYEGYMIWEFEETILWNNEGLFHCNRKVKPTLTKLQSILDNWKQNSNNIAAVGFINYNFKNILFPHLKFKNYDKRFPYLFFGKPKKIKKFNITTQKNHLNQPLELIQDILSLNLYREKIHFIKKELEEGNAYQINFTMPKKYTIPYDALQVYLHLRNKAKPKFGYYLKAEQFDILSFSPELYFETISNKIFSYPMKGTRRRSDDKLKDKQLKKELQNAIKDKSEHLMIVDLLRNDIGKISKYGSVKVKDLYSVESYETVHQMISCVSGILKNNIKECDIIKALFPGGSITGAPKESAMQIIDQIENYSRNLYTGTLGYIKSNGNMNFNMAIRTMTIKDNEGVYPVGGGIVWDSKYKEEWLEAELKSKILT